jgi:hypothetical protein
LHDCVKAVGFKVFIFIKQQTGAKHEVSAIPEITLLDVALRICRVRLFDELVDGKNLRADR